MIDDRLILTGSTARELKAHLPRRYTDVNTAITSDPRTKIAFVPSPKHDTPKRKAVQPYVGVPNEMFPGVSSVDPRYVDFKFELAQTATRAFPAQIDENGYASANGVTRDFSALASCSGVKATPSNAPVVDRTLMSKEAGIADHFVSERHQRIARVLHREMFGRRKPGADLRFSKISSTSQPFFQYDVFWKQTMVRNLLENAERILDCVDRDDLHTLYSEFSILFSAYLVERHQPEGGTGLLEGNYVPKPRRVADMEYALSGGKKGRMLTADKIGLLRDVWGVDTSKASAMRVRTAYGFAGAITYFMSCWFVGNREYYYDEYGFTWHHTTREQIYDKLKDGVALIGLDVTTMDQLYPKFLLDAHAEWLADYGDRRFAKLVSWVNRAPYYAPQLGVGLDPFWAGDPRRLETFNIDLGLSSGRADNPDLGKFYMTWVYLCLMDDITGDVLSWNGDDLASVAGCLKGEHPRFRLLDMSDDAVFVMLDSEIDRMTRERLSKPGASPYAVLAPENGIAFLGNVVVKDSVGELLLPVPNPVTFLVNRFCAEHGIRSTHRRFWGQGYFSAIDHYSRAGSVITDLMEMTNFIWQKHFGDYPTPTQWAARHMELNPVSATVDSLSLIDTEVILDPAKRFYRYRAEDISPTVLDQLTGRVPGELIDEHLSRYWI